MTVDTPRAAQNPWIVGALIALMCAIWGSTWLFVKWGLRDLPPFTSASVRFAIAGAVMALVSARFGRREGGGRPTWPLLLWVGLGQFAMSYGIVYWTEQTLPSGLVAVLWAVFPLMIAGLSVVMLPEERLSSRQWIGFLVAFAGVVSLFLTDIAAVGADAIPSALILLGSPGISALATMYVKRHGRGVSSLALNRSAMLIAAAALGVAALCFERDRSVVWTGAAIGCTVYLAVFGTCIAFGAYMWLMRWVPAHRLSIVTYVTPAIALILGALLDGEPLGVMTMIGTAVILAGVAFASHAGAAARRAARG